MTEQCRSEGEGVEQGTRSDQKEREIERVSGKEREEEEGERVRQLEREKKGKEARGGESEHNIHSLVI